MKTYDAKSLDNVSESDHLSFFNGNRSQNPNDEGRNSLVDDAHFDDQSPFEGIQIDIGSSPTFSNDMIDQDNIVQTHGVRRSSRPFKMPAKFNDFIVGSNVSCVDALCDNNWIKVANNDIEALKHD
ncbi:hypothetical protein Tco_0629532 [Tanacetum coccineum]|uniref:Uncharacterized protein n=1 Tax=Tanacetum coccineum TaxID=301880 RepID=A0ABQ4WTF5_9ASTR